jgi:hypothetical protein
LAGAGLKGRIVGYDLLGEADGPDTETWGGFERRDGGRYCGSVRWVGQETDGTEGSEFGCWDGVNSFGAYREVRGVLKLPRRVQWRSE